MKGAEAVWRTFAAGGLEVCFANPGTSEMHLVAALERVEGVRAVLVLFEGVASGAADGYARMAEKPAATLLHLGPGLGNAIANFHNARRAASPIVNIVGDHPAYHLPFDAPLASDIASLARPVSGWVARAEDSRRAPALAAQALAASAAPPGQTATFILPADAAWGEAEGAHPPASRFSPQAPHDEAIDRACRALKRAKSPALLLRGKALRAGALKDAGRIAKATGARLFCDTFAPRIERGAGRVRVERLPYFPEQALETLGSIDLLLLVEARAPVSFFAYQGLPSAFAPPECAEATLAHPHEDGAAALDMLADALHAPQTPDLVAPLSRPDIPSGALTSQSAGAIVAALLPEGAIISDESATSGLPAQILTQTAPPHDHLALTGGAIGQGLPLATGAAIAAPDRKVVCLHGDGGAMYTLQSLWTQAREKLDVTTVIFSNRAYAILGLEFERLAGQGPGSAAAALFDLSRPDLNWESLAQGMGVEASRARTAEEFAAQFKDAMHRKGPRLIEAIL